MKLLEIAPDFVRSQVGTLLTILQHLEATTGQGEEGVKTATVPMDAVIELMRNAGYSFTYGNFTQLYDSEPRVKALVSNFNEQEITIGHPPEATVNDQLVDPTQVVDKMAQKAAKNINQ
jgi:hypothetical protein